MCCCRDLVYLDLALDGAVRTTVEGALEQLRSAAKPGSTDQLPQLLQICAACAENACLSTGSNQELVLAFRDLQVNVVPHAYSQRLACLQGHHLPILGQPTGTGAGFQGRPGKYSGSIPQAVMLRAESMLLTYLHAAVRNTQQSGAGAGFPRSQGWLLSVMLGHSDLQSLVCEHLTAHAAGAANFGDILDDVKRCAGRQEPCSTLGVQAAAPARLG